MTTIKRKGRADLKPGDGITINMDAVELRDVQWLWQDYIPIGKITILEGHADRGKSTIVLDIATRVTTGAPMPDGSIGQPGGVVILSAEDDLGDTLKPRLIAAGADLSRIEVLTGVKGEGSTAVYPTLMDLGAIESAIEGCLARLLVVDTLADFMGSRALGNAQSVRTTLLPLGALAARTACAVLIVRHFTKSGKTLAARGQGSHAILAVARSAMFIDRDPDREGQAILAPFKANLVPTRPSALAFTFVTANKVGRIEWLGPSSWTAERLCAATNETETAGGKRRDATAFLESQLQDGPKSSAAIEDAARRLGINPRTLDRARKDGNFKSRKTPIGWVLLPGGDPEKVKDDKILVSSLLLPMPFSGPPERGPYGSLPSNDESPCDDDKGGHS